MLFLTGNTRLLNIHLVSDLSLLEQVNGLILDGLLVLGVLLLTAVVVGVLSSLRTKQFAVSIGFSLLGLIVGMTVAMNVTPGGVSAILPAVLVFMGGLVAYLFTSHEQMRPFIGGLLISFCLLLLSGMYGGLYLKAMGEVQAFEYCVETGQDDCEEKPPAPVGSIFNLVGEDNYYSVLISAITEVTGLEIVDPINRDNEPYYKGILMQGFSLNLIQKSLEISWPSTLGADAVQIQGGFVSRRNGGWVEIKDQELDPIEKDGKFTVSLGI